MNNHKNNSDSSILKCKNISKAYNNKLIFKNINFNINSGEYIAIMGESGVGKSTFLNLIAGLDQPNQGQIFFDGDEISSFDEQKSTLFRREKIGFIFQSFHLIPYLTLFQNIAIPLKLNSLPENIIKNLLKRVGLHGREKDFPYQLSGGEMQRVAILRAIVHRPSLLLADEPTGNLDTQTSRDILDLIRTEINKNKSTAIIVTHSDIAAASADRVFLLTEAGLNEVKR